ncbi:MAG: hypothetical protein EXR62_13615 [Chloroflexi bacterium]|nr:hypothetical protein [Chloroflexota bacterium]
MKEFTLGKIAGVTLIVTPAALLGSLLLWICLSAIGVIVLKLPAADALIGGLVATALHWLGETYHHFGHAWAARRTGYPMTGVRLGLFYLLGSSLYPAGEGDLPASIHIRRALGGPAASLLLTILSGLLVWILQPAGGVAGWVAWFFFLENLLIFTLGALLPLGFNDGSTLLYWQGRR